MKKGIYTILLLITGFLSAQITAQTCNKTIDSSTPYIDWQNQAFNDIRPGDTVCLQAGNWNYIQLKNFHGTTDKPIVFINSGGTVIINTDHFVGIKIGNCSHVVFSGNGDSQAPYGFRILKVSKGAGMGIDDYSTDIEISHVEISNTLLGGVYAKTDPTCNNFGATRDKFVMNNFSFHDNYVHDVPDEGLYIGNSHYAGLYLAGCDTTVLPHAMKGVFIFNNLVENTGFDGIQVSSADSNCQIHDNHINYDSQAERADQMSGIMIGGGSVCKTYNNTITNGKGDGIDVFGLGNMSIFNNLIVNAGLYYQPNDSSKLKHGIYIGTVTTAQSAVLGIYNNTIVSPKSFGITLNNTELQKTRIINNLITGPGKFAEDGERAFINSNISDTRIEKSNNYLNNDINQVQFISYNSGNYDLKPGSPAVNYGTDLTAEGVTFDILGRSRPFHDYFDAGAFESHDSTADISLLKTGDIEQFNVYPNPARNLLNVSFQLKSARKIQVSLVDAAGKELLQHSIDVKNNQLVNVQFQLLNISNGFYFIKLQTNKGTSAIPVIIKK